MAYSANIIPTMTSATAPSGVASASSVYPGYLPSFDAWRAFDHSNVGSDACWHSDINPLPAALTYQFPVAHVITQYAITSRNDAGARSPKSWGFAGSNDGATWTTLDTQTDITDWATAPNVRKVFSFANATAYARWGLFISAGNDATYVAVGEMELMENAVTYVPRSIGSGIGSGIASGIG